MSPPSKRMKSTKRMKLTKRITSIDDLPPEMISELFEYLHLNDLVTCSLVNKRWHSIYSNFKVHSLVVVKVYHEGDFFRWYDTNQTVEEKCFCHPMMFRHLAEKPLLSNLKHLAIYTYNFEFDFNELNNFQHLVYLEIDSFPYHQTKVHLNLPRLKVLVIHHQNSATVPIDCPLLSTLIYFRSAYFEEPQDANLEVKQPETIRMLETDMVGAELVPFKSVECLVTPRFQMISRAILLMLPRLREIRYNERVGGFSWSVLNERKKRKLREFLNEAKKLRGSEFRFRFAGLQLTNLNVEQIDFGAQLDERFRKESVSNEYIYMKNYHLVEPGALHFVRAVDYTRLLSHVTGEFPRCFFQKFTGIEWVEASTKVQDPDHFLWFLKSLRSLRQLFLEKTGLGQEFYDQLPESVSFLSELRLRDGHCEKGLQLNFDFISRLSRLPFLHIYPALYLESLISLVRSADRSAGRLEGIYLDVRLKEERFMIKKERGSVEWIIDNYRYYNRYKKNSELLGIISENLNEIVNFFESRW